MVDGNASGSPPHRFYGVVPYIVMLSSDLLSFKDMQSIITHFSSTRASKKATRDLTMSPDFSNNGESEGHEEPCANDDDDARGTMVADDVEAGTGLRPTPSNTEQAPVGRMRKEISRLSSRDLMSPVKDASSDDEDRSQKMSSSENRLLNVLRLSLFLLLISITVMASFGVYRLTKQEEETRFKDHVAVYSLRIIESFHNTISQRLNAIGSMATAITSHAISTNQQFPMVTLPHFELRGSDLRVQSESYILHYMPVVNESMRSSWEDYALENRGQIDEAFQSDAVHRRRQDEELGLGTGKRHLVRGLQREDVEDVGNLTILNDGTGFHPRIWSNGAVTPQGDETSGQGYYLPLWQRR